MAATSKREQLEALLEKAEGSQVASTDLQTQVLNIKPVTAHKSLDEEFIPLTRERMP